MYKMMHNNDQTVKYTKSSKFGLYKYYYYDNDCYQPDKKISTYILVAAILLIISFLIILIIYLCRPKLVRIDLITENSIHDNSSFSTTEFILNITNIENLTTETIENRNIFLENLTSESELETATAMPFLFDWFTPKYTEPQSEPRKNNKILVKKIENIPRPFYHVLKEPVPTAFYSTVNRNLYSSNSEPYRHKVNSIQDVIKYLETQDSATKAPLDYKAIKLTGIYKQPKFEMNAASSIMNMKSKKTNYARLLDPFYHYKPQNPGDINLLAPNTYRFSPLISSGTLTTEKYPIYEQIASEENSKYKIKPVSLLLDIYPMTNSQNEDKIHSNEDIQSEQESNAHIPFGTKIVPKVQNNYMKLGNVNYSQPPNKMVFHLNLYPKTRFIPQRSNPYFVNRRSSIKQRPYYKQFYNNTHGNKMQFMGKLLQNEKYVNNKNYQYIQPHLDKTKLHKRKYITRNLTEYIELNKNDIRPVSEPNLEISDLEELDEQNNYNIDKNQDKNNNEIILNTSNTNFGEKNNKHKEKYTNSTHNQFLNGDNEELQKNLFSTFPPHIINNKYYTTSMPDHIQTEWNLKELQNNPYLINHKNNS